MRIIKLVGIIAGCLVMGLCCAQPRYTFQVSLPFNYHPPIVGVMMPAGSLSAAIAQELPKYCTDVIQPKKMNGIMRQKNISQSSYLAPTNLVRLKDYPMDAILEANYVGQVYDLPEMATFTLRSAFTGHPIAQLDWYYWQYQYPKREKMDRRTIANNILGKLFAQAKTQIDWGI